MSRDRLEKIFCSSTIHREKRFAVERLYRPRAMHNGINALNKSSPGGGKTVYSASFKSRRPAESTCPPTIIFNCGTIPTCWRGRTG